MEYRYSVVYKIHDDGRKSCGIEVVSEDDECSTMIQVVHDICSDEKKLEQLVNNCNTHSQFLICSSVELR